MDQASHLRQLMRRDLGGRRSAEARSPWLVAVSSGKGGVGTTTVALNLALALAQTGRSTILVDADLDGADVASMCRLNEVYSLAHVFNGSRTIHESLCRGPGGIQVLPGTWAPGDLAECTPAAQERLIAGLRSLGDYADLVVLDVGSGLNRVVRRFWHAVDEVLVVTTPEDSAVMNCYAAIKVLCDGDSGLSLSAVVNHTDSDDLAGEVQQRLARACQRFLGMRLAAAGHIPPAEEVPAAARAPLPFLLQSPASAAANAIQRLAERFVMHGDQSVMDRSLSLGLGV